jgi:hypothetical protein
MLRKKWKGSYGMSQGKTGREHVACWKSKRCVVEASYTRGSRDKNTTADVGQGRAGQGLVSMDVRFYSKSLI